MQVPAIDSDQLIKKAAAGDDAAFEVLIRPHLQPAFRLAVTMLGDPAAAEDALQEAAFKAWRYLGRLRPNSELRPWFLTVVANQCRSERRTNWWRVLRGLERMEADLQEEVVPAWDLERALLETPFSICTGPATPGLGSRAGSSRVLLRAGNVVAGGRIGAPVSSLLDWPLPSWWRCLSLLSSRNFQASSVMLCLPARPPLRHHQHSPR